LFQGAAAYYSRFRPEYPAASLDWIVSEFGLCGMGRLLDVGCGTGQASVPFDRRI